MDERLILEKLSISCQHGTLVKNPYTGKYQYVPCGKCEACIHNKATKTRLRLAAGALSSRYTYFVTLTYATKYIPKMKLVWLDGDKYMFDVLPRAVGRDVLDGRFQRVSYTPGYQVYFEAPKKEIDEYYSRACLMYGYDYKKLCFYLKDKRMKDIFPCICQDDFAGFMKRLRYYIFQLTGNYEKISYYIVSEYGPWTFRPHFHFILCFDSEKVAQNLVGIIDKSWQFGTTDTSADRGQSIDYVARYLNSRLRLPSFLKRGTFVRAKKEDRDDVTGIFPRGRFSLRFGSDYFFNRKTTPYGEDDFSLLIDGLSVNLSGKSFRLFPWRSFEDTIFFRPPSSFRGNSSDLLQVIRAVQRKVSSTMDTIAACSRSINMDNLTIDDAIILRYVHRLYDNLYLSDERVKGLRNKLYLLFLNVRSFLTYRGYDFYNPQKHEEPSLKYWLDVSIEYYKTKEYTANKRALAFIESCDIDLCDSYYAPRPSGLSVYRTTGLAKKAAARAHWLAELAIKHREINDRNLIFNRYD